MLEHTDTKPILKEEQAQRRRIHPILIGVLMGLFLLLVRLIFKESSFDKKRSAQKQNSSSTSFTGSDNFQPSFSGVPVGQSEAGMPIKTPTFPSSGANQVGGGASLYPLPSGTATVIPTTLPNAQNLTSPEAGTWEVDPLLQPEISTTTETATNWRALGRELAETIVLTLLIFLIMRALVQNYRIEGYSMEPNLHEQQYLIVNKVAYYLGSPERGDIIVFEYPNGPETDYIKRVIGVPGDTVECRPNEILVNGVVIDEPYNPHPWTYTCLPQTMGEDEYFVLGDNRSQSSDSHKWGVLERKFIIGKAWISYWPMDSWGRVANYPIEAPDPKEPLAQTQ